MEKLTLHKEETLTESEAKLQLHHKDFYSYEDFLALLEKDLDKTRFDYFEEKYTTYGDMIDGEFLVKFDKSNYKGLSQMYIGNNPNEINFSQSEDDGFPGKKTIKPGETSLFHVTSSVIFENTSNNIPTNRDNPVLVPNEILSSPKESIEFSKI